MAKFLTPPFVLICALSACDAVPDAPIDATSSDAGRASDGIVDSRADSGPDASARDDADATTGPDAGEASVDAGFDGNGANDATTVGDASAPDGGDATAVTDANPADAGDGGVDTGTVSDATADATADATTPLNTFYVSPSGNDTTGDGSASRPWKTITAALSKVSSAQGVPTINLADGTYDETVLARDSVILQGSGSSKVTIQNSAMSDTGYVVTADGTNLTSPPSVTLRGIRVHGSAGKNPGIRAARAVLLTSDVNVYQPGGFGISIGTNIVGFIIDTTTVGFQGLLYSDLGVDVGSGSSGTISNFTGGDHIDHIINIGLGCNVTIRDSVLTGSPIYYADGIRIQGASTVAISNTRITRAAGAQAASSGPTHNPPYAGIEIASSSNGNSTVRVDNCTINGFDVGVGINLVYNQVLVQNSTIGGNLTDDVRTVWSGTSASQYPIVDFGGGSLGSVGLNNFGSGVEYAVRLGGPYGISAKSNSWGVTGTAIEGRIYDQIDDPLLGRVLY